MTNFSFLQTDLIFRLTQRCISVALALSCAQLAVGQSSSVESLASWVAIEAPTGHEHLATDKIRRQYPGWQRDRTGNLVKTGLMFGGWNTQSNGTGTTYSFNAHTLDVIGRPVVNKVMRG